MKLSIIVAVYNHEKYIEKAIRSIMAQKTNFEYEVLIGEDCSTDNSKTILKTLEKECPSNFKFFYRKNNLGSEENFRDLYSRMIGKYFIVLEGDDYWIYDRKLQEQVDFLDHNSEYIACAHNVMVVNKMGQMVGSIYPECKENVYDIFKLEKFVFPGQTASIMCRNYYMSANFDLSIFDIKYYAGDQRKAFFLAANGKVYCFQKVWSAYRFNYTDGNSYSANIKICEDTYKQDIFFRKQLIEYSKSINNKEIGRASCRERV